MAQAISAAARDNISPRRQLLFAKEVEQTNVRETMKTPEKYREDAWHCRELLDRPLEPELKTQLRLWAAELDDMADAIERGAEASAMREFARPL